MEQSPIEIRDFLKHKKLKIAGLFDRSQCLVKKSNTDPSRSSTTFIRDALLKKKSKQRLGGAMVVDRIFL